MKLSIVTINFNGYTDTCELTESLKRHMSIPYELIIVDNDSKNGEAQRLKKRYPEVVVIVSEKNLGFSGGNNLGIKASDSDFVLLLNNDTIIEDDTIKYLLERMESDSSIGGVSPKLKFNASPRNIQYAGYTPLSPITLRNRSIGYNEEDDGSYNLPHTTPYVHGAAMLIRRSVIDRVGDMPEQFFLYYEELDWSTTIRENGYNLWYEPRCTVYHKESNSTGVDSPLKIYYITRNRLLYTLRHRVGVQKNLSILFQIMISAPKNVLAYALKGKWKHTRAIIKGIKDYVANNYN